MIAVVTIPGDAEVQCGVAVLARNAWVARQGRDALRITWGDSHAFDPDSGEIYRQFRALTDQAGVVAMNRGKVLVRHPPVESLSTP